MIGDTPVAWVIAGVLLLVGGAFHLAAATRIREWNAMDFFMRGPPFEDLTPGGQAMMILSWLFTVAAVALILVDRFPHLIDLLPSVTR